MKEELRRRIDALGAESARVFTEIYAPQATLPDGALSGLAISVKDNIDVAGRTTTAASRVYQGRAVAVGDAPVVRRLRQAGADVFAKTNMSEFAYSTHGINPHFGTPANPRFADGDPHIPGGSSSGAAAAVARGLGDAAIGTDTAGSVRIPAALCGVVGFKPRQRRIPRAGVVPLSASLDCVGVLARSVSLVSRVFAAIADADPEAGRQEADDPDRRFRILIPTGEATPAAGPMDPGVAAAFDEAIGRAARLGRFEFVRAPASALDEALALSSDGGISAPEAYALHAPLLEHSRHLYDAFTLYRLGFGERCTAERYRGLLARRRELIPRARAELGLFDAVAFPTCPIIARRIADLQSREALAAVNGQLLRHTVPANVLDLASISIACGHLNRRGEGPVGLSLDGVHGEEALLQVAAALEAALSP